MHQYIIYMGHSTKNETNFENGWPIEVGLLSQYFAHSHHDLGFFFCSSIGQ